MKNLLLPIVFVFCVIGLKSQNNITNQRKQVGQFAWKHTAEDSVNILQLPFMREMWYLLPNKGNIRGAYYILQDKGSNSAKNNKQ